MKQIDRIGAEILEELSDEIFTQDQISYNMRKQC